MLLFLSSVNLPRNLIEQDWFRTIATYNPVSYLVEGVRSLIITGWDGEALALGFGLGRRGRGRLDHAGLRRPAHEADPDMRRFFDVTHAVAWRTIHNFVTNPAYFFPSVIFPLFFFTAFAGGLSSVGNVPGFDFPAGYTAFQFVFVLLQASAFGGVFTGFGIAAGLREGLRPPAAARRAEPARHPRRLRRRGADARRDRRRCCCSASRSRPACASSAAGSTCSGSSCSPRS